MNSITLFLLQERFEPERLDETTLLLIEQTSTSESRPVQYWVQVSGTKSQMILELLVLLTLKIR